jgi:hypothetical protein
MERVDVSYESTNGFRIYKLISREQKRPCNILALERGRGSGRGRKFEGQIFRIGLLVGEAM